MFPLGEGAGRQRVPWVERGEGRNSWGSGTQVFWSSEWTVTQSSTVTSPSHPAFSPIMLAESLPPQYQTLPPSAGKDLP